MSGEPEGKINVSHNKFHPLITLCCECNTPLCNDINHQSTDKNMTSTCLHPIDIGKSSHMSNMTDFSTNANHPTDNRDYSPNVNHSTNNVDVIEQSSNTDYSDKQATSSPQIFQNDFNNHRGIHMANVNIRHLKPKLDEIKIMLRGSSLDIFGICETFLSKTFVSDHFAQSDQSLRCPHEESLGP